MPEELHAVVNGIKINYVLAGNKNLPILLLIHGLGNSLRIWERLYNSELTNKVRILALDLVGFGNSDKPKDFSYSIEDHANVILQFLKLKNFDVKYIVGFSMGGTIAVYLASHLSNLEKLILIEPTLTSNDIGFSGIMAKSPKFLVAIIKPLIKIFPRLFVSAFIEKKDKANINLLKNDISKVTPTSFILASKGLVKAANNEKTYKLLETLAVKKYYIISDYLEQNKRFNPPSNLFEITEKIVVPKSRHCLMLDNFPYFYNTIQELLSST